ncbi:hypothetical protein SPRG_05068 [Saprolegnia parasitica CBS 223.65]|uniref:HCNGP-like protein n=1 Tax=Saprolegnia parasitica (strain CBS 223.65) TaxID=695850 RepID=A0A067CU90_SAPPC|nr:hypothetical protein SPRG_05068 [Saprolegnia parasitica CBS 223.65]KDO30357.1 hypothetical protein SPRG_05068 [Saprolegnia parasitica CBS 223.65]|eukprot:XP_012198967.1 hypothetical protein SPRG_05068 [Saprolegnia parasitica CBS 223.65]
MALWNPLGLADYGSDSDDSDVGAASSPLTLAEARAPANERPVDGLPELPPLPAGTCRPATQAKVDQYIAHTQRGLSFTASLRSKKEFDNPYILEKVVDYFSIEEMQSNLDKAKFNPYGYHVGDNYNRLALALRSEQEAFAQQCELNPALRFTAPTAFANY